MQQLGLSRVFILMGPLAHASKTPNQTLKPIAYTPVQHLVMTGLKVITGKVKSRPMIIKPKEESFNDQHKQNG